MFCNIGDEAKFLGGGDTDRSATVHSIVTALFSSKKMWINFRQDLEKVEEFFPGLRKVSFEAKIATGDAETRKQFLRETRIKMKASPESCALRPHLRCRLPSAPEP